MSGGNSVADLVDLIESVSPKYLKLFSASTDEEFDQALDPILADAVSHLEANSKNFGPLDEEGLTAALAGKISMPGLAATQEANSNGHVDITIQVTDLGTPRKKLGEAKIWNGPAYHVGGLEQLLNRYTTGREGRGLVITYVRKKDIAGLIQKLRDHMDKEEPCDQQGKTQGHTLKWSFLSQHAHSCGEVLGVCHIGCNLYNEGSK